MEYLLNHYLMSRCMGSNRADQIPVSSSTTLLFIQPYLAPFSLSFPFSIMLYSLYVPLLLASGALAAPTTSTELARRGTVFNIGEIIADIIDLKNHKVNAWDPDLKHTCVLRIQTTAGGACQAQIACDTDIGQGR
jgi:hypothetical protein